MTGEMMNYLLSFATLILGTGWLFTYKAYKRKNEGEATQAEADGWAKQQEVYKKTIVDLEGICDRIREDRNHLRDDRNMLRDENEALRQKYKDMEEKMNKMQDEIVRLDRMVESLTPFLCGNPTCIKRTRIELNDDNEL